MNQMVRPLESCATSSLFICKMLVNLNYRPQADAGKNVTLNQTIKLITKYYSNKLEVIPAVRNF